MDDPTRLGAVELAAEIRSGALTSAAAVEAHLGRIEAVDGTLNAVPVAVPLRRGARRGVRLRSPIA